MAPAKISQLTIASASTYSLHSRRYGVTITGLLVTIFPAGHLQSSVSTLVFLFYLLLRGVDSTLAFIQVTYEDPDGPDQSNAFRDSQWTHRRHSGHAWQCCG